MSGRYAAVTLTLLGLVTVVAFEAMSISTVMPSVAADLNAQSLYGLTFSLMFTAQLLGIVVAGSWIDVKGPMPAVWAGQGLFTGGSVLAGIAPTLGWLSAGRVVAGLGAGLVVVAIYVVIGSVYPQQLRPRVFGWLSAAWVLPSVVGPLVAAWLAEMLSWRAVFLVVLPVSAVLAGSLWVFRDRLPAGRGRAPAQRSDPIAAAPGPESSGPHPVQRGVSAEHARVTRLGLTVATGAGLFQWASGTLLPLRPLPTLTAAAGLGAVALAAPRLVPAGTVRLAVGLPSVMAARFLVMAALNGGVTFVPLLLVAGRGANLTQAGIVLAVVSVGWAAGAFVQGHRRLAGHGRSLVAVGACFVALALAVTAGMAGAEAGWALFVLPMTLLGLGMGLATAAMSVLMLDLAGPAGHARASSALQLSDVLGSVLGLSVCGALFTGLGGTGNPPTAGVFAVIWGLSSAAAAVAAVAGWRSHR